LRNQNFACVYIDAFAGSGTRTEVRAALPLFENDVDATEVTSPGSASIAITTDPPLDEIVLIEQDDARFAELQALVSAHTSRKVVLRQGDANPLVRDLCTEFQWRKQSGGRRGTRGVIFLDPYGMEVDWSTVEAIASTKALDCWYFFPLSGLYRNAPHDLKRLDAHKEAALDRVLGATDWRQRWYEHEALPADMFETEAQATRRADIAAIEAYVKERLRTVFKGAVLDPIRLHHKNGPPMASLFFAVSNDSPPAVRLATEIASHILNSGRSFQRRPR
jgi:three-Cys-motif partner protein